MSLAVDPVSKLLLPRQFIDEKVALKKVIDDLVDSVVINHQHLRDTYYLSLHAKFDHRKNNDFTISKPVIASRLPPFISNQFVFWVNNKKSICELLWVTSKKNGKLKVDFNTKGVAFLQAKGAMPS